MSISSTFYEQLLCAQISKAQKKTGSLTDFAIFGSGRVIATCKMLMKLTRGGDVDE